MSVCEGSISAGKVKNMNLRLWLEKLRGCLSNAGLQNFCLVYAMYVQQTTFMSVKCESNVDDTCRKSDTVLVHSACPGLPGKKKPKQRTENSRLLPLLPILNK